METRIPLEDLVSGLRDPAIYEAACEPVVDRVEIRETNTSVVFLTSGRAFKIRKPVRLWGLLDYATFDARRECSEAEVRLGRRFAPDVYGRVATVVRRDGGALGFDVPGDVVEHAVVMARLPVGCTFVERLHAGSLADADLRRAAEALASQHAAHRLASDAAGRVAEAFGTVLERNVRATRACVPEAFPAAVHDAWAVRAQRQLDAAVPLLSRRAGEGRTVDGHGDVRLEHVLAQNGRIQVIDAVEFTELLRHIDPLSDAAFLAMDLTIHDRRDLASAFTSAYLEAAGESADDAARLLPLFLSYRAHVRAKVAAWTARAPDVGEDRRARMIREARRHLALAWTYAREGETPPVVVMSGPSGSGKSVLARALAPWLHADLHQSDRVRKELAGLAPTDRPEGAAREALYAAGMSARTYAAMLERAEDSVRSGRAAILDATYLVAGGRRDARDLARRLGAPFVIVEVECTEALIRRRIQARMAAGQDPSDADFAVYREQMKTRDLLDADERTFAVVFHADGAPEHLAMDLLARLETAGAP